MESQKQLALVDMSKRSLKRAASVLGHLAEQQTGVPTTPRQGSRFKAFKDKRVASDGRGTSFTRTSQNTLVCRRNSHSISLLVETEWVRAQIPTLIVYVEPDRTWDGSSERLTARHYQELVRDLKEAVRVLGYYPYIYSSPVPCTRFTRSIA